MWHKGILRSCGFRGFTSRETVLKRSARAMWIRSPLETSTDGGVTATLNALAVRLASGGRGYDSLQLLLGSQLEQS